MKILKVLTSIILIINSVLPNLIIFNKPKIESVIVDKAIIRVETNIDQGQYCFQYPNTIPKENLLILKMLKIWIVCFNYVLL